MAFESLLAYSRFFGDSAPALEESAAGPLATALDGQQGNVYLEEAFGHFLEIERRRASRSGRQFLLLLVGLHRCPYRGTRISPSIAPSVLSGLGLCVREVDLVGWYRHERVAGAVLTQGVDGPDTEAPSRIVERVVRILSARLPKHTADRLRVRVVRLGAPAA